MGMTWMKKITARKRIASQFESYNFALLIALGGPESFFCAIC
jgi:hypothetical protein